MDMGQIIALLGSLAAVATVVVLFIKSRGENKAAALNAKTALDARIDARVTQQLEGAWKEIDTVKEDHQDLAKRYDDLEEKYRQLEIKETRRSAAMTRILRDIARQWPGTEGPILQQVDIAEIEETIPAPWIHTKPT